MNGLDLFSGIGGLGEGLKEWVTPIAYCESDAYAQSVLLSRMQDGSIPAAPIWDDVRSLDGRTLPKVDIIYGGFPCQDISIAGRGEGLAGKRSGLFYEIIRLTSEVRPTFVFLENVPAIRTRGLREVIGALTELRYDCRWTLVSASETGAHHLRRRFFLLATDSLSVSLRDFKQRESWGHANGVCDEGEGFTLDNGEKESLAHSDDSGLEKQRGGGRR